MMYIQLYEAFGWKPFETVFAEYARLPAAERPRSDDDEARPVAGAVIEDRRQEPRAVLPGMGRADQRTCAGLDRRTFPAGCRADSRPRVRAVHDWLAYTRCPRMKNPP